MIYVLSTTNNLTLFNSEFDSNMFLSLLINFLKLQTEVERITLNNRVKKYINVHFVVDEEENIESDDEGNNQKNKNNNGNGNIVNKQSTSFEDDEELDDKNLDNVINTFQITLMLKI